jgi:uncharacterized protein
MKLIQVRVKPNARVSTLREMPDGTWLAQIKSPPIDGRANEELVALVAAKFARRKAQVSVKSGGSGRMKLLKIE